jgi:hypothetical protein
VYAKRQAYKKMYEQEQTQHMADNKKAADKVATLEATILERTSDLTNKTLELANRANTIDTQKQQLDKLTSDLVKVQLSLSNEQAQVLLVETDNSVLTKRNDELVRSNDQLGKDNKELIDNLSTERGITRKLTEEKAALEKDRETLQVELAQAKDTIALNTEVFAELSKINVEARALIADFQNMPAIDARVLAVLPETRTVVLNVGLKQGVRKNFNFTIFRGNDFIAKVYVFDVQDRQCAARIITPGAGPVKINDEARTRMHF